jgi:hypothetical protein
MGDAVLHPIGYFIFYFVVELIVNVVTGNRQPVTGKRLPATRLPYDIPATGRN